jgi:ribosomal protein L44E
MKEIKRWCWKCHRVTEQKVIASSPVPSSPFYGDEKKYEILSKCSVCNMEHEGEEREEKMEIKFG